MAALLRITISRCIRYFLNFSKKFNRKTNRNFLRNPSFSKIYFQRIKYKKIPSSPKLNLLERLWNGPRPIDSEEKSRENPTITETSKHPLDFLSSRQDLSLSSPSGRGPLSIRSSAIGFVRYTVRFIDERRDESWRYRGVGNACKRAGGRRLHKVVENSGWNLWKRGKKINKVVCHTVGAAGVLL